MKKNKKIKTRNIFKVKEARGEISLRTRSESLDSKNLKYSRRIKFKKDLKDSI